MFDRHREKAFRKIYGLQNKRRSSNNNQKSANDLKSAFQDKKKLKHHRKRLGIGWFFRPD